MPVAIAAVETSSIAQGTVVADAMVKTAEVELIEACPISPGKYWVLIGGEMPSVLVEISHLSNSAEEERLGSPAYRKQVAQGIYDGIIEYMRSLGKG